jgi:flagellar biosynthetic protein FliO
VPVLLALLQDTPPPPSDPGGGYGWFLFETLIILAAVCALAWIVIRVGVRKLYPQSAGAFGKEGALRIVARLPLEPRRSVYILEAAGKTLLVGVSEGGPMTTLAELDPAAVAELVANTPKPKTFLELLRRKAS